MNRSRRDFLRLAAGAGGLALTGWAALRRDPTAEAHHAGLRFLAASQSADGAWRSERYAAFREGDALTPVVLWALSKSVGSEFASMRTRAQRWLETLAETVRESRDSWSQLRYPLFTASYAAQALAALQDQAGARFWAGLVEQLRLRPELGWAATEPECGTWGDAPRPPQRPAGLAAVPDLLAPNLSATVLGLQALQATGQTDTGGRTLRWIELCQNFRLGESEAFADGGFFFTPGDPVRNKAGIAGRDRRGQLRFNSYGSATCDGLLALEACGLPAKHPRRRAALDWLVARADGLAHRGRWAADRAAAGESLVFYHAQAFAAVLSSVRRDPGSADWAQEQRAQLARDLIARQDADGAWAGRAPDSCEDEPLLATAFALRTLAEL